ncbi:MAG: McrC family protein [Selenomonadaceae bacterium]|nr:McrC family protein [Selenomonadaceae bacterium]
MNNLLTVCEYQKIFREDCPKFDELARFAEASDFLSLGWHYVQTKNYVGVIRLPSGFQIEILPKIYNRTNENDLRGLVVKMLRTLKNFSGKNFLDADLQTSRLNLYEIFIRNYLDMVSQLVKRGLKSSYILREENLRVFKGKLLVGQHVRKNFVHREKFFVAFDEYSLNRPEHRLIKAALDKLRRTTNDRENLKSANRLLADFDSVDASSNFAKDFSAVKIDRQNRAYENVMAWTKIFLADKTFTSFAGKSEAQAILFPMEKLFEAYVAHYVKKIFSDNFTVTAQVREKFLFDVPKSFALKPDILLTGDETIIMDTKWKFSVTEADMYQMFVYSKRYAAQKIFLLCPLTDDEDFICRSTEENFSVRKFSVDLFDIDESIKNLREIVQ